MGGPGDRRSGGGSEARGFGASELMNPFDLTGPWFLLFYVVLSFGVFFGMWFFRKALEGGDCPAFDTSDAYLIGYLRGGIAEAARVATVSLVERGLLQVESDGKVKIKKGAKDAARNLFEQAVLTYFQGSDNPAGLFKDSGVKYASQAYADQLARMGALPSAAQKTQRIIVFAAALGLLLAVGMFKIDVAISRGRYNIGFLIGLMIVDVILTIAIGFPRLTAIGSSMVADLQSLFSRLKKAQSTTTHGTPNEAVMLAAVFGMAAMPAVAYPYVKQLFPKATSSSTSSCGSSCGSSSSDSGGGSSCGGGCGGGCGGCGS